MIKNEIMHYLKRLGATKHYLMAVKTDMSKAYDTLELNFV